MTRSELAERDPSNKYFIKQHKKGQELIFVTYAGTLTGTIDRIDQYELFLTGRDDPMVKHDILYCFKPDTQGKVDECRQHDPDILEDEVQEALTNVSDRLAIPVKSIREWWKKKVTLEVWLRNGDGFRGTLNEFGIFSFRLSLTKKSRIIIMKPNIYDVSIIK